MSGDALMCGLPTPDAEAAAVLEGVRTLAVVGLSPKPDRASHQVAEYAQTRGYRIIPIYPRGETILGERVYPSLTAYGQAADLVVIFRRPDAVPEITAEAVRLGCGGIWMQEGISHAGAADTARAAGLKVVQNRCLKKVLAGSRVP